MTPGQCTEACGWVAAVVAAACIGSFGVPVKGGPASRVNVDPLVMQSYKTVMCFLTCWLVVLLGETVRFTPWGVASGLFWVPGATAGIYGIRNAGLAVAVGTWSSLIVASSFFWGIFVFREGVRSVGGACCAGALLCAGLAGMGRYSAPPSSRRGGGGRPRPRPRRRRRRTRRGGRARTGERTADRSPLLAPEADGYSTSSSTASITPPQSRAARKRTAAQVKAGGVATPTTATTTTTTATAAANPPPVPLEVGAYDEDEDEDEEGDDRGNAVTLLDGRLSVTRRQLGILGAVINGTWGGTNLIPMHYASLEGYGGPGYTISFACGGMIVTLLMWVLRYLYLVHRTGGRLRDAYDALPSFHLREMWFAGVLSGTLYSAGNFSAIIAVVHLGQGVGYSVTQSAMLVSGLWGIFYFGEIRGGEMIAKWMASAAVAVVGILWLGYEHEGEAAH